MVDIAVTHCWVVFRSMTLTSSSPRRARALTIVVVGVLSLLLSSVGVWSARADSTLAVPFEPGVKWYVCQGYNGIKTHYGNLANGLDLTTESTRGQDACWGNPNAASGRVVTAPAAGTARPMSGDRAGNYVCISFDSGDSMAFMHLNSGGRPDGRVASGTPIGTVAPEGQSDNGGYAHVHLMAYQGAGCSGPRVPFTGRFHLAGAPDLPNTGARNQHAGTEFVRGGGAGRDLVFVKTRNTTAKQVEVHRVSASSGYMQDTAHTATWFGTNDQSNGYFQVVGDDLYFIKTRNTGSGRVEVHSATAASGYKSGEHHVTWFSTADQNNGWFQMVGNDLWFIKTKNTGSKRVEVHNATASSGYRDATVHAASWIGGADEGNGFYQMVGNDLWFIKTKNTGSKQVEVHNATASSGYRDATVHAVSWIGSGDANNGWFQMVGNDLVFVKTTNSGSGKVEVHDATAGSGYRSASVHATSWFSSNDRSNGWFQIGSK